MAEEETYVVEEVTISESDDEFEYQSVNLDLDEDEQEEMEEDYDILVGNVAGSPPKEKPPEEKAIESKYTTRHESTDDFVRNFLVRLGMAKTLETFQAEWYELKAKGKLKQEDIAPVPDVYLKNQELRETVSTMRQELEKAQYIAEKAKATWDKLRREKDHHRMHHHRVQQEKQKYIQDIEKLKKVHEQHEGSYRDLSAKYEAAMKEKMLMKLERDRLKNKIATLEQTMTQSHFDEVQSKMQESTAKKSISATDKKATTSKRTRDTPWPPDIRPNPHISASPPEAARIQSFSMSKTYQGHQLAISTIALHPRKPIVATASDDHTWKIWSVMTGDLIFTGFGHTDWVGGVAFHPKGTLLASCSGDSTVKIWDFMNSDKPLATFTQHAQAVWCVDFNDTGDFMISGSMDHSVRLWDVNTQKCRNSFRGHVDSVNNACFQPYTNTVCTGSGDKTVSIWDMRTGHCTQTYYGHLNSVNHVTFNYRADVISSCDSDGVVKLWDTRMVRERTQFDTSQHPANASNFDRSGQVLLVASEDATVYSYNPETGEEIQSFRGHEQGVLDVKMNPNGKFFVTAGGDATFRIWQ